MPTMHAKHSDHPKQLYTSLMCPVYAQHPCRHVSVCGKIVSPLACGGNRSAVALAIARPASAEMHVLKQFLLQAAGLLMANLAGCLW